MIKPSQCLLTHVISPSPLSPGLRSDRAATALYNDLREPFVFQGAVYTMATYHTGDRRAGARRGPRRLKYKSPRRKSLYLRLHFLYFYFFCFSTSRALLHSSLSLNGAISTNEVGLFVVCLFVFLSAAANACNYEKRGERDTYLAACACMCAHVEEGR